MSTQKIPKIIHQIWIQGVDKVPPKYQENIKKWKELHPEWEHKVWSGDDIIQLLTKKYPDLLPLYKNANNFGERADIGRYAILDNQGGVYIDMDMIPYKCINPLMGDNTFVASKECDASINNAMIGSIPGHPIWSEQIIPELIKRQNIKNTFLKTGPIMFTSSLLTNRSPGIKIYDKNVIYGDNNESYAYHSMDGQWKTSMFSLIKSYIIPVLILIFFIYLGVVGCKDCETSTKILWGVLVLFFYIILCIFPNIIYEVADGCGGCNLDKQIKR